MGDFPAAFLFIQATFQRAAGPGPQGVGRVGYLPPLDGLEQAAQQLAHLRAGGHPQSFQVTSR